MKIDIQKQVDVFKDFFDANYRINIHKIIQEGVHSLIVNFTDLAEYDIELSEQLIEEPEETMKSAEIALEQFDILKKKKIRVRFYNLPLTQEVHIRNLRSHHIDKFIFSTGIVRQASDVRPQVTNARFECPACGNIISILQIEQAFREPSRCSCGRRGRFKLLSKDLVDAQRLVVEEAPEMLEGGEQPKRISIFLKADLVEPKMEKRTTPGSKIKIFGVVKELPIPLKTGTQSTRYDLMIDANYIEPLQETYEEIVINEEDEKRIIELSKDPRVYEKLIATVAPSIYGHEDVKSALVLQLFGGVRKERKDGTKTRGDTHLLLVGDPGSGKSELLKFIAAAAPKARYISGKGASSAGLTASVVKDEFLKGWALEAGAIVLANGGIACLDELDKMGEGDSVALHEAMEQQCMLPDFKLMLSNGEYVKIGGYVDKLMEDNRGKIIFGKDCEILETRDIELLSTDFSNSFSIKTSRASRHIAPEKFIKIELSNGRSITVTPEHPCWVIKEGKLTTIPAYKLTKSDYFPIPSSLDIIEEEYTKENDNLCKILGYHISDGCYELNRKKKNGIQFWNNDLNLIEDYKRTVENFFKIKTIITRRKHQFAVRVISKKVADFMRNLDVTLLEKGIIKKIPNKIMMLPRENIKYLLRALFDGDGTVVMEKRNGCRVSLSTENLEVTEQVCDLLLRFGITSSIFIDKNTWKVDISGQENLSKFLLNISFLSAHKKQRLENYCSKNKTYKTIKDVIPNCTDKINKIFKYLHISARREIGHSIDMNVEKQRLFLKKLVLIAEKYITNKTSTHLLNELEDIKKIAFGFSRWMKIKQVSFVKNKGIKWVYDVTIEPYHTFISNGMILHNTVTISKANIQAMLKAQTTILAAANPKLGRFDPYQLIAAQIEMAPTLINRFDLIFIIKDLPTREKDDKIASHILKIQKSSDELKYEVPLDLFKKYIAYAKQRVNPKLTDSALKEIKEFYVNLRNMETVGEAGIKPIPITARQLEALVRLAEASARVRLSKQVTKLDSKRAINILKHCLMAVGFDYETQTFDIDRISTGITASQRSKIVIIREIIDILVAKGIKSIPLEEIISEALGKGLTEDQVEEAIDKLKREGIIFEPRRNFISKV